MAEIRVNSRVCESGEVVPKERVIEAVLGCLQTLEKIGKLGKTIKVFHIMFVRFNRSEAGPRFEIVFQDPLGQEQSHTTDFRFIGSNKPYPKAEEIADALCARKSRLPLLIIEHLERCAKKYAMARDEIGELTAKRLMCLDGVTECGDPNVKRKRGECSGCGG